VCHSYALLRNSMRNLAVIYRGKGAHFTTRKKMVEWWKNDLLKI
jgi:hypothetical protein